MSRAKSMAEDEILSHPITSITDGWVLRDGRLHLEVSCWDGAKRYVTVDRDRHDPTAAIRFMEQVGVSYS